MPLMCSVSPWLQRHWPRPARLVWSTYASFFLVAGAVLPFLPVWLEGRGFDGPAIGFILGTAMVCQFVVSLVVGLVADRVRALARMMQALAWLSAALCVLMVPPAAPWLTAALVVAFYGAKAPLGPLQEMVGMAAARRHRFRYSLARGVGSLAFVVANFVLGALIAVSAIGAEVVVWWNLSFLLVFALGIGPTARLAGDDARPRLDFAHIRQDFWRADVVLAFASNALVQASHAFFYAFSAIIWIAGGISGTLVGALWAWGVLAEVILLFAAGRWLERLGAARLLMAGAGVAVVRWVLLGLGPIFAGTGDAGGPVETPPLWWLFVLQTLHAGTFAVAHMGMMVFIHDHMPARVRATAQNLNSGLSMGAGLAMATAVSGVLFAAIGTMGYWGMVVLAVLALVTSIKLGHNLDRAQARGP